MVKKTKHQIKKDMINKTISNFKSLLEKENGNWSKCWAESPMALNPITPTFYKGGNWFNCFFNTFLDNAEQFSSPYYLTFKQISKLGHKVIKDCKKIQDGKTFQPSTPIQFYEVVNKTMSLTEFQNKYKEVPDYLRYKINGDTVTITFFNWKYYNVFNVNQTTIKDDKVLMDKFNNKYSKATNINNNSFDDIINGCKNIGVKVIDNNGGGCFYIPATDTINMIRKEQFNSNEDYLSVLFHELAHSTMLENRCNRINKKKLDYANEELVAELTSVFLSQFFKVSFYIRNDHTKYIKSWLKSCDDDKKAIEQAFKLAEKASNYLVNAILETGKINGNFQENLKKVA